jgi:hypothetical protein
VYNVDYVSDADFRRLRLGAFALRAQGQASIEEIVMEHFKLHMVRQRNEGPYEKECMNVASVKCAMMGKFESHAHATSVVSNPLLIGGVLIILPCRMERKSLSTGNGSSAAYLEPGMERNRWAAGVKS